MTNESVDWSWGISQSGGEGTTMAFHCIVCLDDYVNKAKEGIVWSRKCGHVFHHSCVTRWLATCRQKGNPETCPKCGQGLNLKQDLQVLYDGQGEKGVPAKRTLPRRHPSETMNSNSMDVTSEGGGDAPAPAQDGTGTGEDMEDMDMEDDWSPDIKRSKS